MSGRSARFTDRTARSTICGRRLRGAGDAAYHTRVPTSWDPPKPAAEWHRLLAPLPGTAVIARKLLDSAAEPDPSSPLAGWEQFVVELAEGFHARRVVHVLIDGDGALLSAGDHLMTVVTDPARPASAAAPDVANLATERYYHESVGGRFDGEDSFDGTHWRMWTVDTGDSEQGDADEPANAGGADAPALPAPAKRKATAEEGRELRRIARDVLARAGVQRER